MSLPEGWVVAFCQCSVMLLTFWPSCYKSSRCNQFYVVGNYLPFLENYLCFYYDECHSLSNQKRGASAPIMAS